MRKLLLSGLTSLILGISSCGDDGKIYNNIDPQREYQIQADKIQRTYSQNGITRINIPEGNHLIMQYRFNPDDDSWKKMNFFSLQSEHSNIFEGEQQDKPETSPQNNENGNFYVFDYAGGYYKVEADNLATIGAINLWVDNNRTAGMTNEEIEQAVQTFAQYLVPRQKELFGNWLDVNGDQKLDILFTNLVKPTGMSYFNLNDLTNEPNSNQRDMIVVDPRIDQSLAVTTMTSSLQYLITTSQRIERAGLTNLTLPNLENVVAKRWLMTGMTRLAQDLLGIGTLSQHEYSQFLKLTPLVNLRGAQTLCGKGGSYLLLWKALSEKLQQGYEPTTALHEIQTSGIEAINSMRGLEDVTGNPSDFFERFVISLGTTGMDRAPEYEWKIGNFEGTLIGDENPEISEIITSIGPVIKGKKDEKELPGPKMLTAEEIGNQTVLITNGFLYMVEKGPQEIIMLTPDDTQTIFLPIENPENTE